MNGKKLGVRGKPYKKLDIDWDRLKQENDRLDSMTDEELDKELEARFQAATCTGKEFLEKLERGCFSSLDISEDIEELKVRLRKEIDE